MSKIMGTPKKVTAHLYVKADAEYYDQDATPEDVRQFLEETLESVGLEAVVSAPAGLETAIRRSTPKRVRDLRGPQQTNNNGYIADCPECKTTLRYWPKMSLKYSFCPTCGQAVLWM